MTLEKYLKNREKIEVLKDLFDMRLASRTAYFRGDHAESAMYDRLVDKKMAQADGMGIDAFDINMVRQEADALAKRFDADLKGE